MSKIINSILEELDNSGNLRTVAQQDAEPSLVDLSSNDYLGLAADTSLRDSFLSGEAAASAPLSASASRLLASSQKFFTSLETTLSQAYGSPALLFNSGYHANTGIVGALGSIKSTYIIADKLVHASIIDGIKLSGAPFTRFRHNDYTHLGHLAAKASEEYRNILIIAESVYSMDGDKADIEALAEVKRRTPGAILYIDEAHAVGVEGDGGLGLVASSPSRNDVDIIVGTFGKALASAGAYAIVSDEMRQFLINKARSFIFSTALPPFVTAWSEHVFRSMMGMDSRRMKLRVLGTKLTEILRRYGAQSSGGHIQPLIAGSSRKAIEWSRILRSDGFCVLPIRTPTVPPGTERLRFSLSADIDISALDNLSESLSHLN
ncbi:MAG: 8-amino-7-oxononanoate synthase [Muribaculaceae bacterium]|nr:8-amino-7-oxononanoate synthase [Muribaculaceae bacterium]